MSFQIVWFTWDFGFVKYDIKKTDMALIYDWILSFGIIQIRKWHKPQTKGG